MNTTQYKDLLVDFLKSFDKLGDKYSEISSKFEKMNLTEQFTEKLANVISSTEEVKELSLFKYTDLSEKWDTLDEELKLQIKLKFAGLKGFTLLSSMKSDDPSVNIFNDVLKRLNMKEEDLNEMFDGFFESLKGTHIYEKIEVLKNKFGNNEEIVNKIKEALIGVYDDFSSDLDEFQKMISGVKTVNMETISRFQKFFNKQKIKKVVDVLGDKFDFLIDLVDFTEEDVVKEFPTLIEKLKGYLNKMNNPMINEIFKMVLKQVGIKQKPKVVDKVKKKRNRRLKYKKEFRKNEKKKKKDKK